MGSAKWLSAKWSPSRGRSPTSGRSRGVAMSSGNAALITGASAGLGLEYAKLFAADGVDVVLVARRRDRLEALAKELEGKHRVRAHVIAADLGSADGPGRVLEDLRRIGLGVACPVDNAGFWTRR